LRPQLNQANMFLKTLTFAFSWYLTTNLLPIDSYFIAIISQFVGHATFLTFLWQAVSFGLKYFVFKRLGLVSGNGKSVLITGCDTGFGHHAALRFNQLGFHVFAGCLNTDSKDSQLLEMTCVNKERMQLVQLDVTDKVSIVSALELVTKKLAEDNLILHSIVNNAGIATANSVGWVTEPSIEDFTK